MADSSIHFVAIGIAAIASWFFGAIYYTSLGQIWLRAQDRTSEQIKAINATKSSAAKAFPFILSFVAEVVMAGLMSALLVDKNDVSVRAGLTLAVLLGLGFVAPTISVDNAYAGRKPMLTLIDSVHWICVLLITGSVIGAF